MVHKPSVCMYDVFWTIHNAHTINIIYYTIRKLKYGTVKLLDRIAIGIYYHYFSTEIQCYVARRVCAKG